MNLAEEAKLADLARRVKHLRECIDTTESMLRTWADHEPRSAEIYHITLKDHCGEWWHASGKLPVEIVQMHVIPTIEHINHEAMELLRDLTPEIKP